MTVILDVHPNGDIRVGSTACVADNASATQLADGQAQLPAAVAAAAWAGAKACGATLIRLASTFRSREVASWLGAWTGWPVIANATAMSCDDGQIEAVGTAASGQWESGLAAQLPAVVVLDSAQEDTPVTVTKKIAVSWPSAVTGVTVISREQATPHAGRPELSTADVVVAGGRGTDGDFSVIEQLADVLGGAVGATRVAVEQGWIGTSAQIGSTGVVIHPQLYVAAGIAGALYHTTGIMSARRIVAINTNPDAPIFSVADFGVVGDLHTVLPATIAALKAHRG